MRKVAEIARRERDARLFVGAVVQLGRHAEIATAKVEPDGLFVSSRLGDGEIEHLWRIALANERLVERSQEERTLILRELVA